MATSDDSVAAIDARVREVDDRLAALVEEQRALNDAVNTVEMGAYGASADAFAPERERLMEERAELIKARRLR